MKRALLFLVLFSACALPEDTYFVSGTAPPSTEVRLLRNRFGSKSRCDALEPLDSVMSGDDGRFSFSVVRQQITGGESERRFFSVEFGEQDAATRAWRFWFPDADFELGAWEEPQGTPESEVQLDGQVAWRGMGVPSSAFDRDGQSRGVNHAFQWREVPIDSLGRVDYVPLEKRVETPWRPWQSSLSKQPRSRGAECPFIDVRPCPLTDGRFLPFTFPPDSRALIFKFDEELRVGSVLFHGLLLERPAVRVRYDFNFFIDYEQWNPSPAVMVNPAEIARHGENCIEPGAMLSTASGPRAVILRVRFEDEAGNAVPIVSLQEVTIP